jgi:muramidase (phage lysozyme)
VILQFASILSSANVRALLMVIRAGESRLDESAYTIRYGGWDAATRRHLPPKVFDPFLGHPRVFEPTPTGEKSSAAGAFQETATTFDWIGPKYGIDGFSPYAQECHAVALIHEAKALDDIIAGDLERAVIKCGRWWASLPDSGLRDGGSKMTWARVRDVYATYGGALGRAVTSTPPAEEQPPAPIEDRSVQARPEDVQRINEQEEAPVAGPGFMFLFPLLEALTKLLPQVGVLLGKDVSKSQPKIDAGMAILNTVIEATGATNGQEAVEKMAASPAVRAVAQKAVEEKWFEFTQIVEVGGGIEVAWKRNADPSSLPFYRQGAFYVTIALFLIAGAIVSSVLWGTEWRPEDRSQVLMLAVSILSAVMGYWLGSSIGSSKKTDILAHRE